MENNHHLSQSQLGVFWFLTKLTWSMQPTTAWCWLNLIITNFIENRHFTYHNIVAKFRSSYYIDRNIVNNRKPYTKNFLTTCQVSHYDFPQNSSYTLNPYIVALSFENRSIRSHQVGIMISKILNVQTISNMSLKYHIGTYQYCQPIKARHNMQELIMNWPFKKLNKEKC